MNEQQQQNSPRRFSQAKYHHWEFLTFDFKKKMIPEVLLVLPLYLILFFIWLRFQPLIKAMTDFGDTFDDDFFGDIVDTPKEGIKQDKKTRMFKDCHGQV